MHSFEVHSNEIACRKLDVLVWNKSYVYTFFGDGFPVRLCMKYNCKKIETYWKISHNYHMMKYWTKESDLIKLNFIRDSVMSTICTWNNLLVWICDTCGYLMCTYPLQTNTLFHISVFTLHIHYPTTLFYSKVTIFLKNFPEVIPPEP